MLTPAVETVHVWVTVVAAASSGIVAAVVTRVRTPGQKAKDELEKRETEAELQRLAVETVESAMKVARDRIGTLETRVKELTEKIGELRGRLEHANEDRVHVREQLDLALMERAKLLQQIIDMNARIGDRRRVGELMMARPADAIVMVNLEDGIIEFTTEGIFGLLGFTPSELVGQPLEMIVPDGKRLRHVKHREEFAQNPHTRAMGSGLPLYAVTTAGTQIPVDISLHPTGDGRVMALMKRRDESAKQRDARAIENRESYSEPYSRQPGD